MIFANDCAALSTIQSAARPCGCHHQELSAVIDDWLQMTTTSSGVYSGQIALVSLRRPSLSPPFPLAQSLERDGPHGWISGFWMAKSPSGWD